MGFPLHDGSQLRLVTPSHRPSDTTMALVRKAQILERIRPAAITVLNSMADSYLKQATQSRRHDHVLMKMVRASGPPRRKLKVAVASDRR